MNKFFSQVKNLYIRYTHKISSRYLDSRMNKYLISKGRRTSLSDNDDYPALCYVASKYNHYFRNFRRNEIYNRVLEHVSQHQGQEYLDVINRNKKLEFTDMDWNEFRKNDLYGNPRVFPYEINGYAMVISPTTVRYAKVLQDIVTLFEVKKISSVAEIGIGYGGECRLLTSYLAGIEQYFLFDIPEALGLAKRYLGKFESKADIRFVNGTNIDVDESYEYDVVISNYAFSELIREVQDMYLEKVISKSKAGYITWNSLSHDVMDGYSVDELLEKIPGSSVIAEEPLTAANNCIIIWGNR